MKRIKAEDVVDLKPIKRKRGNPNFVKGMERPENSGRKPGSRNKTAVILKEAMLAAMERVGDDNKGRNGAVGYLAWLAWKKPELFSRMLEKLLPFTLTGANGGPVQLVYENKADVIQRMKERNLPIPPSLITHQAPDVQQ